MTLKQDNFMNTLMPNGLLRWHGFDFDHVELPDDPLLPREDAPVWIGSAPGFQFKHGILDAKVTVDVDQWDVEEDPSYDTATPKCFRLVVIAHGFDHPQTSVWPSWHEVQQAATRIEQALDYDFNQRHADCENESGNPTEDACSFCTGIPA